MRNAFMRLLTNRGGAGAPAPTTTGTDAPPMIAVPDAPAPKRQQQRNALPDAIGGGALNLDSMLAGLPELTDEEIAKRCATRKLHLKRLENQLAENQATLKAQQQRRDRNEQKAKTAREVLPAKADTRIEEMGYVNEMKSLEQHRKLVEAIDVEAMMPASNEEIKNPEKYVERILPGVVKYMFEINDSTKTERRHPQQSQVSTILCCKDRPTLRKTTKGVEGIHHFEEVIQDHNGLILPMQHLREWKPPVMRAAPLQKLYDEGYECYAASWQQHNVMRRAEVVAKRLAESLCTSKLRQANREELEKSKREALEETVRSLEADIQRLTSRVPVEEHVKVKADRDRLKSLCESLEFKSQDAWRSARLQCAHATHELKGSKEAVAGLTQKNDELQEKCRKLERQVSDLQAALAAEKADHDALKSEHHELLRKYKEMEYKFDAFQRQAYATMAAQEEIIMQNRQAEQGMGAAAAAAVVGAAASSMSPEDRAVQDDQMAEMSGVFVAPPALPASSTSCLRHHSPPPQAYYEGGYHG